MALCSSDFLGRQDIERVFRDLGGVPPMPRFKKGVVSSMKLIAKKALSKDLRTLIKAEVIDDELDVENQEFVLQFIVNKYTKELAEEAQKVLDEQEQE